jgi:hypothetical protein
MVKLQIGQKSYGLPDRLPLSLWSKLAQLDLGEPLIWPRALHILTGAPLEDLVKADHKALELGMGFLLSTMSQRRRAAHVDFTQIRFGQWIDLDVWLIWGVPRHIEEIMGILAPQCQWTDEALWIIEEYAKWRLSIYKSYSALFGLDEPTGEPGDEPKDKMAIARGWYAVLVKLAGGDILKLEAVEDQPLKKALNMLAYQKQVEREERARELEIKRKYDLQRNSRSLR